MNLYLRLICTLIKTAFLPPIRMGEAIERRFRVLPNDLDINAHMNNGRYMTIVDLMIVEYFIRCGLFKVLLSRRWRPMLGGSIMHFRRGLKPFDVYTLRLKLVSWDERWNYMAFEFLREGRGAASGLCKGAVVGRDGFVGNTAVHAAAGVVPDLPTEPEAVALWRETDRLLAARLVS